MVLKQTLGALTFVLTLFASTANDEQPAPVQSFEDERLPVAVAPYRPILCDSAVAEDCFAMFSAPSLAESITVVPPRRHSSYPAARVEPVVCSSELPSRGDRCGSVRRAP
jgi:hypothetical protein